MKIKYRVVLKISYNVGLFEFDTAQEACELAEKLLKSMVDSEDQKKLPKISFEVVNVDAKEEDE